MILFRYLLNLQILNNHSPMVNNNNYVFKQNRLCESKSLIGVLVVIHSTVLCGFTRTLVSDLLIVQEQKPPL